MLQVGDIVKVIGPTDERKIPKCFPIGTIYEDYLTDNPTKDDAINALIPNHTDENTKQAFMRRMNITNCSFPFSKK